MALKKTPNGMAHRRTLLGISITITILNFAYLVAGAGVAGTIAYAWDVTPVKYRVLQKWNWWYINSSPTTIRGVLVAFYCITPLVLFFVSLAHTIVIGRRRAIPIWSFWVLGASVLLSVAAWTVQMGLEGKCAWGSSRYENLESAFCPFVFGGSNTLVPMREWPSGTLAAWVLPWLIIPLFFLYAALLFYGFLAARITKRFRSKIVANDNHNLTEVADEAQTIPKPGKQVSFKTTRASSRFTDVPVSSVGEDVTLGPPSYDADTHGSWKPMDEKSRWSIDEKRDGNI